MINENQPQPYEPDSSVTSAFKVTLPENVFNDLTTYADAKSLSKSDIIREAVREKIAHDNGWNHRLYLFKKQGVVVKDFIADLQETLKVARKGTLVKIAVNHEDEPNNSGGWIFYLSKFDDEFVYLSLPNGVPPSKLDKSTHEVSLESGMLIVPQESSVQGILGTINQLTYKVPMAYVWDIETDPPSIFGTSMLNTMAAPNFGNLS